MNLLLKILVILFFFVSSADAQKIPSPKAFFGFNIGDDYKLANYTQTENYFKKLAALSDRVIMQKIGTTEENRSQYMMIISSPANLKQISRYKMISQHLARADVSEAEAAAFIEEGKPVVWIDGGLHATETVGSQQLIALCYKLLSSDDPETLRILDNVIILLSEVNPDGQELVVDWYMQQKDPGKRNMRIPRLYNKYAGHDNNRDFYMMNLKETKNVSRQLYVEWMPQIVYNHHQSGPPGSVIAGPPYRDPFNYVYDPLVITGIDGVAASMINRLNVEGKPGYTRLSGSGFNTWWNGGLRTTPYYHNMIGLLTEIVGSPTPSQIPLVPDRLIPDNATPYPVTPQPWHFKQSIDYSLSLNYAVLDYASRMGSKLLENIYQMGRNSIKRGSEDYWTARPNNIEAIKQAYQKDVKAGLAKKANKVRGQVELPAKYYDQVLKNPVLRDPRGYIIPADQTDFPTAVKFINALIKSGIKVYRATAGFSVEGKSYPAESYIVKTDQAFRPHVLDMFEPQNYRNDFQYPGGPPIPPYDATGWTLAFQMGVKFDRILHGFTGPFEQVAYGEIQNPPPVKVERSATGYLLSAAVNNAYIVVNDLLAAGIAIERITTAIDDMPEGSFYISANGYDVLNKVAVKLGVKAKPVSSHPSGTIRIKPSRIALFDHYGGSIPSGWVRWLMEQFHYKFTLIYPQDIDRGDLNAKYDVILFIDDGIPPMGSANSGYRSRDPKPGEVPHPYDTWLGRITVKKSIPQLKTFIENGGNVVTVGRNTCLAYHLDLPVKNALMEKDEKGEEKPVARDKYYIPTSVLRVNINTQAPATWGMPRVADIIFNNSPVFKLEPHSQTIQPLAWFGDGDVLRSGWAWGQSYLKDGVTAFVASVGKGKLYAFGPEITFRAQAHGTFKMLFNELYQQK